MAVNVEATLNLVRFLMDYALGCNYAISIAHSHERGYDLVKSRELREVMLHLHAGTSETLRNFSYVSDTCNHCIVTFYRLNRVDESWIKVGNAVLLLGPDPYWDIVDMRTISQEMDALFTPFDEKCGYHRMSPPQWLP